MSFSQPNSWTPGTYGATPLHRRWNPTLERAIVADRPQRSAFEVMTIGDPTALVSTYADVVAIETPENTIRQSKVVGGDDYVSYHAIDFAELIDHVRDCMSTRLGVAGPDSEHYVLSRGGKQLCCKMAFGDIAVMVRSSHDGSISVAVFAGRNEPCCSNGVFPAEGAVTQKHTSGIRDRLPAMIWDSAADAADMAEEVRLTIERLTQSGCSDDRFAAVLGISQRRGFLNNTQANRAWDYWLACHPRKSRRGDTPPPLFAAHSANDMSSALQAMTGGLRGTSNASNAYKANAGALLVCEAVAGSWQTSKGVSCAKKDVDAIWIPQPTTNAVVPALPAIREYRG